MAAVGYVGGGIDRIETPVRPIPVASVVGARDDGFVETANNPAIGAPPDPLYTELPLDPVEFQTIPNLRLFVTRQVATAQMEPIPDDIVERSTSTVYTYRTPLPGNTSGNVFEFAVLAGLEHHYPHGDHAANPEGFVAAVRFWEFFQTYGGP